MRSLRNVFSLALLCSTMPAWATVCQNATGVPKDISYDLSNVFNSSNNKPGQIVTLAQKSGLVGVNAICPKGTTGKSTMRSYVTSLPITTVIDGYKYVKLNDYLDGAMQILMTTRAPSIHRQTTFRWGSTLTFRTTKRFLSPIRSWSFVCGSHGGLSTWW